MTSASLRAWEMLDFYKNQMPPQKIWMRYPEKKYYISISLIQKNIERKIWSYSLSDREFNWPSLGLSVYTYFQATYKNRRFISVYFFIWSSMYDILFFLGCSKKQSKCFISYHNAVN